MLMKLRKHLWSILLKITFYHDSKESKTYKHDSNDLKTYNVIIKNKVNIFRNISNEVL